jgi:ribosome-associated protein
MITHDLRLIADAMQDKKAQNVISLDLRSIDGAIADFFVICNADSTTNVDAVSRNVEEKMAEEGHRLLRAQGQENGFWIIQDYGNIIVHIFLTQYREFYRLEDLWADVPRKEYKERPLSARKRKTKE